MIWNGKRAKGVQVYRGKRGTEFAGEYLVAYPCNGYHGFGKGQIDAIVCLQKGDTWPDQSSGVSLDLLSDWKKGAPYVAVSYRNLTDQARSKLEPYIFDD